MPARIHGHSMAKKGSPEFRTWVTWVSMRQRCFDQNRTDFKRYGGRGIDIDPDWDDYRNFLRDMGLVPKGYSIDRKDNNAGYSKQNCEWASRTTQSRNRRSNKRLEINGVDKTLAEWAEESGLHSSTIRMRIKYNGGVIDESLLKPVSRKVG